MKKRQFISVGLLAILSNLSYATEIDYGKLNPVLQTLAEAAVKGDDLFEFASPRFDEVLSDLESDRLKYDLNAHLGGSEGVPWSRGGKAELQVGTTFSADRSPSHLGIAVGIDTQLRTEIMPLIRYSARMALRKKTSVWPTYFEPKIDAHLRQLAVARSLGDVYILLQSGQRLATDIIKARIESDEERIAQANEGHLVDPRSAPDFISDTKKSIEKWKRVLEAYQATTIQAEKVDGIVTQLMVHNSEAQAFTEPSHAKYYAEKADIKINPHSFQMNIKTFFPTSQKKLDRLKSRLKSRLLRAQNHDAENNDYVQNKFRDALIEFKATIRGEF